MDRFFLKNSIKFFLAHVAFALSFIGCTIFTDSSIRRAGSPPPAAVVAAAVAPDSNQPRLGYPFKDPILLSMQRPYRIHARIPFAWRC